MAMIYKSSKGRTIRLTSKVGSGGEGDIYLIDGDMKYVAKIYNDKHKPNIQKQNKLTFMLNSSSNINLLNYVCMPVETLSLPKSGEFVGFIMQNLTGWVSIFNLYHPSLRKEKFPDIQWDFLLNVARNIAAAFDEIHLHEYIIGDVNESGIMIEKNKKGIVKIIDSDSFQIYDGTTLHYCEVGKPEFTPPELQGEKLNTFRRTANHDNFGLAKIIFMLLFNGRSPFQGKPKKVSIGGSEKDHIRAKRYVHAPDAAKRGLLPQDGIVPIAIVPEKIRKMFVRAFTEDNRPTAKEWVDALDELRSHIVKCKRQSAHAYPDQLVKCPWCTLEQQGIIIFSHNLNSKRKTNNASFIPIASQSHSSVIYNSNNKPNIPSRSIQKPITTIKTTAPSLGNNINPINPSSVTKGTNHAYQVNTTHQSKSVISNLLFISQKVFLWFYSTTKRINKFFLVNKKPIETIGYTIQGLIMAFLILYFLNYIGAITLFAYILKGIFFILSAIVEFIWWIIYGIWWILYKIFS